MCFQTILFSLTSPQISNSGEEELNLLTAATVFTKASGACIVKKIQKISPAPSH